MAGDEQVDLVAVRLTISTIGPAMSDAPVDVAAPVRASRPRGAARRSSRRPARFKLMDQRVHRVGLVEELDRRRPTGLTMLRRALQGHADEGDLDAGEVPDLVRREERSCRWSSLTTFAARYWKSAPAKPSPSWQPSTGWQPPFCMRSSSVGALIELVVADGVDVEADRVHRLDGRLVVEQRRQQRARADQVARTDGDRVRVLPSRSLLTASRGTRRRPRGPSGGPARLHAGRFATGVQQSDRESRSGRVRAGGDRAKSLIACSWTWRALSFADGVHRLTPRAPATQHGTAERTTR